MKFNSAIPEDIDKLQADQIPWNNPHWHPAHGGIYRNVRVYVMDPLHISLPLYSFCKQRGRMFTPRKFRRIGQVNLEVPMENAGRRAKVGLKWRQVFDRNGHPCSRCSEGGCERASEKSIFPATLPKPELWESDYPYLYRVDAR